MSESNTLLQVKHIIAVASGKGGVGKSTTAVNLALALAANGAKIGLLDADIYGPSLPTMLGVEEGTRPGVVGENAILPVMAKGLATMSLGYLMSENTPAVWRGPMASSALQQMLNSTAWGELDCLVVDMPPGTGDIQLTLSQKVQVSGAIIVTTPQDIALLDAIKGIEMVRKVNVPVLGIIENMALHICSQCGHEDQIFGAGGGERISKAYNTRLLGSLPLDRSIREQMDSGNPSVIAEPQGAIARHYLEIGGKVSELLDGLGERNSGPQIEID